jgi:peptidoglycan hydrolase-like protein with peptidoglycan-binding domain
MVDEAFDAKAFSAIKKGEKSERVKQLQKDLGLTADGVFGSGTEAKVKEFQTTNKLAETEYRNEIIHVVLHSRR